MNRIIPTGASQRTSVQVSLTCKGETWDHNALRCNVGDIGVSIYMSLCTSKVLELGSYVGSFFMSLTRLFSFRLTNSLVLATRIGKCSWPGPFTLSLFLNLFSSLSALLLHFSSGCLFWGFLGPESGSLSPPSLMVFICQTPPL